MTCAEVEELIGARALDALPVDEARRVDEHVRDCAEHRETLDQLRRTTLELPLSVEDREPPAALRQRVLDAVRDASRLPIQPVEVRPQPPAARRGSNVARLGNRLPGIGQLTAAAAIVLALVFGYVAGSRIGQPPLKSWTFAGSQVAPAAQATVVYSSGQKSAVLAATGLPALSPGHVYEAWLIRGNTPVDVGVSTGSDGKLVLRISRDLSQFDTLAITIEPGEQAKPTTTPILAGKLS